MAKITKVPEERKAMTVAQFVEKYGAKPDNFSLITVQCAEGEGVKDVPLIDAEVLVTDFDGLVTKDGQERAVFVTHAMARGIRVKAKGNKDIKTLSPEFVLNRVAWAEEIRGAVAPLVETATEIGLSEDELVAGPVGQLADKVHAGLDLISGWFEMATPEFEAAHAAHQAVWGQIREAQEASKDAFQRGQDWQDQLEKLSSYAVYQTAMEQFLAQVGARLNGPVKGNDEPFIKTKGGEPCVVTIKRRETVYLIMPRVHAVVLAELMFPQYRDWVAFKKRDNPRFEDRAEKLGDFTDMIVKPLMRTRTYVQRKLDKDREAASYSERGFKNPALAGVFSMEDGVLVVTDKKDRRDRRGFRGKKDRRRDGWGARD